MYKLLVLNSKFNVPKIKNNVSNFVHGYIKFYTKA